MRRLLLGALIAAVAVTGSIAGAAQAHPIRECGDYGYTRSGAGPFFRNDGSIQGAGTYNITSRAVTCGTAHKLVKRVEQVQRVDLSSRDVSMSHPPARPGASGYSMHVVPLASLRRSLAVRRLGGCQDGLHSAILIY